MYDALGNELKVGDKVVTILFGGKRPFKGTIIRITPKRVLVSGDCFYRAKSYVSNKAYVIVKKEPRYYAWYKCYVDPYKVFKI